MLEGKDMTERNSVSDNNERKHTQWDGLFVSQHAWDSDNVSDPQPMLSADEKQASGICCSLLLTANVPSSFNPGKTVISNSIGARFEK